MLSLLAFRHAVIPLQLLFSGDKFEHLSNDLYADGLGYNTRANPRDATFLHWNGIHKPWLDSGLFKEYWEKYGDQHNSTEV